MEYGGVVLAGGLSARMGTPKAALEWHGSTLLYRTVAIVARATGGPVAVVRAKGQELPALPAGVLVTDDPRAGKGPVQGLAAGLAALAGQAGAAFVASTDLPFLHPAFVARVLRALEDGADVALPVARGYRQPLAAAYRTALAEPAGRLVAAGRLRPAFLFEACDVTCLDEAALLADPVLARLDPGLDSVVNVNTPAEYRRARRRPPPAVTVRLPGAPEPGAPQGGAPQGSAPQGGAPEGGAPEGSARPVRAATVAAAAEAAGLPWGGHLAASLNGGEAASDPMAPLAEGDAVALRLAGPAQPGQRTRAGAPGGPAARRGSNQPPLRLVVAGRAGCRRSRGRRKGTPA